MRSFGEYFTTKTHDSVKAATQYMSGLMQASKKNMERMAEVVPDADDQALQHFLTNSPWDERPVMDQVAREADVILGGRKDSCLLIDESGFQKKGTKSVGVDRQWLGRQGKVDNGQVGVFAALAAGDRVTPVDVRLYLPKSWVDDPARCREAGVPEEEIRFRSKHDLALEMVEHTRSVGLRYRWVAGDAFYGDNPAFLNALDDMGQLFVVDVHKDQRVYLSEPSPYVPERRSAQGRKPTKLKTDQNAVRVDRLAMKTESEWRTVTLRGSTKGKLTVQVFCARVWTWDGEERQGRIRTLVVTRTAPGQDVKFSLSNAPAGTRPATLARRQRQRYWIERTFEDGKSESGMADYQVRKWRAWHHHMALVMLAMLFMLKVRAAHRSTVPLLSCADIEELLAHFLPRRDITHCEVLRQMEVRHRKRQRAIDWAYTRQEHRSNSDNVTK